MEILFIRSYIPDYDGKFQKYKDAIETKGCQWHFLGWNRHGSDFTSTYQSQSRLFKRESALGAGWKSIISLILWNFYIIWALIVYFRKVKVIHVIDLDSAIFPFLFARLFRKKIIFDVYDKYTSMRFFPKSFVKILDAIERFIIYHSDLSIIADAKRLEQHAISIPNNLLIVENIPVQLVDMEQSTTLDEDNSIIKIGYFGVLEQKNRGIEDIISSILSSNNKFELHIVGYGTLEEVITNLAASNPLKIFFYGAMSSKDGLKVMQKMDILLGFYYRTVPNHLYAAPNKYYEHLMLGKPLLTTFGTPPGDKVEKYNTGWALVEGLESIKLCLSQITRQEIIDKSACAHKLWVDKYQHYFETVFCGQYAHKISQYIINKKTWC